MQLGSPLWVNHTPFTFDSFIILSIQVVNILFLRNLFFIVIKSLTGKKKKEQIIRGGEERKTEMERKGMRNHFLNIMNNKSYLIRLSWKLSYKVVYFKNLLHNSHSSSDRWNYTGRLGENPNCATCNLYWNLKFPGRASKFCGWFCQIQYPKLKLLSTT